jgi:hypothetical protein
MVLEVYAGEALDVDVVLDEGVMVDNIVSSITVAEICGNGPPAVMVNCGPAAKPTSFTVYPGKPPRNHK